MGLLSSILKKGIRDLGERVTENLEKEFGEGIGDEIEKKLGRAVKNAVHPADGYFDDRSKPARTDRRINAGDESYYEYDDSDPRSAAEKIAAVLAEEFPQYEVRENVSPSTIGGTGRCLDYSFGVYENGEPKLFIMLVGKDTCGSRVYRWSKEQAEKAGVTMINFVEHYPNRPGYIKERLHQYI